MSYGPFIVGPVRSTLNTSYGALGSYGPLIKDTATTLTHIWVPASGVLSDTMGRAWGQVGSVKTVNWRSQTPFGIGYWTGSFTNYLTSTDSGAMRPTGNFNATIILSASAGWNGKVPGWHQTGGSTIYLYGNGTQTQYQDAASLNLAGSVAAGIVVISFGYEAGGPVQYVKVNRIAKATGGSGAPATETTVFIGRGTANGQQWADPIYEYYLDGGSWVDSEINARHDAILAFFGV